MAKQRFNPALPPHVIMVPLKRMNSKNLDRAIAKLADFFVVNRDLEHVIKIAEWYNYEIGNADKFVFAVDMESEYHRIAMTEPSYFEMFVAGDDEENTIVIL